MAPRLAYAGRRRLKLLRLNYRRFVHHFGKTIYVCHGVLDALSVFAAVICLIALIVLVGFDHTVADRNRLLLLMHLIQGVFIVNIVFDLVLRTKETLKTNKSLKWCTDIAMLITVIPLLYPQPENPWINWLSVVVYSPAFLYGVLGIYSVVEVCYGLMRVTGRRTNPSLLLSGSFLFFILLGSIVLMLPKCTYAPISYIDSLFVATSAVCITGLTPVDISSTFTPTGIAVMCILFQIGGLGVLTFTVFFAIFFSGSTSVYSQLLISDLVYSKSMNALVPTLLYILVFTLVIEAGGAVAFYFTAPQELFADTSERLTFAIFHSMSAFCNAGFSCVPGGMSNSSFMTPGQTVYMLTSLMVLLGGIGFPILVNVKEIIHRTLRDIWRSIRGQHIHDTPLHMYDLNTKLVLTTYMIILAVSALSFFILEYNNTLAGMTLWQKVSQSLFNSLCPRSSGFASVSPGDFLPVTMLLIVVQMWIGGASQSLAGGIKVNTVAALWVNIRAIITGRSRAWAYGRAISQGSIRRANAVVALAVVSFLVLAVAIMLLEPAIGTKALLFEVTSALFTVGSSLGITAELSEASKGLLCIAMFIGRVGIISLLCGLVGNKRDISIHLPEESIIIN